MASDSCSTDYTASRIPLCCFFATNPAYKATHSGFAAFRLLIGFDGIDFCHRGIKQSLRWMRVVGDIENDFLIESGSVAAGQRDSGRVDSLDYLPVPVNRDFFIAVTIAGIARAESFLHGK